MPVDASNNKQRELECLRPRKPVPGPEEQKGTSYTFTGLVTIVDGSGSPVNKAAVEATWTLGDGAALVQTATTNKAGVATFGGARDGAGAYTLCVTSVTKDGYDWAPGDYDYATLSVP